MDTVKIGIIGDLDLERPSHRATNEALRHCALALGLEINIQWLPTESLGRMVEGGLHIAGTDELGEVRILELPLHRFYVATLFQPQLRSTPDNPHKLITAFLVCAGDR